MDGPKIPLQIGVTGGIGSGKSVVCKVFACLGIKIYDADSRAKWLTNHNEEVRQKIVGLLGDEAYTAANEYNRKWVAAQVFDNPGLLTQLNKIIHPAVGEDTEAWVNRNGSERYVIKEAAIMKAAGDHNDLDYVVVVKAPIELRIQRILARDHRTEDEIRAIMKRQVSEQERDAIADFQIFNDEQNPLIPQVSKLHEIFLKASLKEHAK